MCEIATQGESHDRQSDARKPLGNKEGIQKRSDVKGSLTGFGRHEFEQIVEAEVKAVEGASCLRHPPSLRIFLPPFPFQPPVILG